MAMNINSSMANILFGSKNTTNAGSFLSASALGDWTLMRSGIYTRMLRSYYEKYGVEDKDKATSSEKSDKKDENAFSMNITDKLEALQGSTTNTILSDVKSAAGTLGATAQNVADMDYETVSREDMYATVKKMADSYNAVLQQADKSDVVSITQSTKWMKNDTTSQVSDLENIGITVSKEGKLSVDKETFAKADVSTIQDVLGGSRGYASRLAQKATGIQNLATNQLSYNSGRTFYSSGGILGQ